MGAMNIQEFATLGLTAMLAIAGYLAVYVLNSIKSEIRDIKTSLSGLEKDMRGVVAGLEREMNAHVTSLDRRVSSIEGRNQLKDNSNRREGNK